MIGLVSGGIPHRGVHGLDLVPQSVRRPGPERAGACRYLPGYRDDKTKRKELSHGSVGPNPLPPGPGSQDVSPGLKCHFKLSWMSISQ